MGAGPWVQGYMRSDKWAAIQNLLTLYGVKPVSVEKKRDTVMFELRYQPQPEMGYFKTSVAAHASLEHWTAMVLALVAHGKR